MSEIVTIGGSPTLFSRSAAVLRYAGEFLNGQGFSTHYIAVRELPAEALLTGQADQPAIRAALSEVATAQAMIIATPVYKAAYSGLLKVFLDLLPQNALADKVVLPLATGGSAAHTLAIDYSLKPVLTALGARQLLNGVYLTDAQVEVRDGQLVDLSQELEYRLHNGLAELVAGLTHSRLFAASR